jgi:amino acid adenylation domain-containing protein
MRLEGSELLVFDQTLREEREYWTERLSGRDVALGLESDYDRPKEYFQRKENVRFPVPEEIYKSIVSLTGGSDFLIYTVLMTALKLCLNKCNSYNSDNHSAIIIGSPVLRSDNGRQEDPNVIAIVDDIDDGLTFRQNLVNIRKTLLDAYTRQHYPFRNLINDLNLGNIVNRCPLFDVVLAYEEIHQELPELRNDITIVFTNTGDSLIGNIIFNSCLFNRQSIVRLTNNIVRMLWSGLNSLDKPICEISLLTCEEYMGLLREFGDTRQAYPHDRNYAHLFETQVENTPDAVAVTACEQRITYKELNALANRLAAFLRSLGVGPEDRVGVYMRRDVQMVIGVLAAFKANAAYVPLDTESPAERLAFILSDAEIRVVLTCQQESNSLVDYDLRLIKIDADWPTISRESEANLYNHGAPENIAYVLYTSGSTGRPKGVMINQKSLVNYLSWVNGAVWGENTFDLPLVTKLIFDASLKQLLSPLIRGDQVWILPEETLAEPTALLREIAYRPGSGVNCVPTLWAAMLDMADPDHDIFSGSRPACVLVGGEQLSPDTLTKSFQLFPETQIWNLYGPTETTANAAFAKIDRGDKITIGRPTANTQIYILDNHLNPMPVGAPGELCIEGDGIARGYLNRPALTAEKFIPNPFGHEAGARLYRSGDLSRYLSDGKLEYLGRVDDQVKVRGFRIELGEIEVLLRQHPAIRGAAVRAVRNEIIDQVQLIAYIVPKLNTDVHISDVRRFLTAKLPAYMIPSSFVLLDEIPRTATGKVDRRALPLPDPEARENVEGYIAPRTMIEEKLAHIWSRALGVGAVSVNDNFFELGGHSLLATQVISQIRKTFEVALPLPQFFTAHTLADVAFYIQSETMVMSK